MKQQKPLIFVEHPDTRNKEGIISNTIEALKQTLMVVKEGDGYYLTQLGEYFGYLLEQRKVSYDGSRLIVKDEVKPGLTFTFPGCGRDKMAQIGNDVLMFYRKESTVLPSLKRWYPLQCSNIPILSEIGRVAVKVPSIILFKKVHKSYWNPSLIRM